VVVASPSACETAPRSATSVYDGGGVVRLGSKGRLGGCRLCRIDCAGVQHRRTTLQRVERQLWDGNCEGEI
jgi:hypothetical protein